MEFRIYETEVNFAGPLLRNHDLGGKFQNGDLIFDTRNISLYELLMYVCMYVSFAK